MSEPSEQYDLADDHEVELCGLYSSDVIEPDWDSLDSGSNVSSAG